jgi:hypothetical protein
VVRPSQRNIEGRSVSHAAVSFSTRLLKYGHELGLADLRQQRRANEDGRAERSVKMRLSFRWKRGDHGAIRKGPCNGDTRLLRDQRQLRVLHHSMHLISQAGLAYARA